MRALKKHIFLARISVFRTFFLEIHFVDPWISLHRLGMLQNVQFANLPLGPLWEQVWIVFPIVNALNASQITLTLKYRHDYGHKHDPFWIGWYHVRGMGTIALSMLRPLWVSFWLNILRSVSQWNNEIVDERFPNLTSFPQSFRPQPQPVIICFLHHTPVKRMTNSSIILDSTEDWCKTESVPFERRAAASG